MRVVSTPRSGLLCERRVSATVVRRVSSSPGRTGRSQRSSSTPGDPRLDTGERYWSASSRIISAQVCQPLAISPPKGPAAAASASTWNGCGSNRRPNSTTSASSTRTGPNSLTVPGT